MYYEMIGFTADSPPLLPSPRFQQPNRPALFLDFDGTLVDLVDHPDHVDASGVEALLSDLHTALDGRVAIITGRAVNDLKTHLDPGPLPVYGSHGAELWHDGTLTARVVGPDTLDQRARAAEEFCAAHDGLRFESKPLGFAIHFRQAPDLAGAVHAFITALLHGSDLTAQPIKMGHEVKIEGVSKGAAIRDAMDRFSWTDAQPVMIGDDLTDEDGMQAAIDLGGYGIKVGEGHTLARRRVATPSDLKGALRDTLVENDGR